MDDIEKVMKKVSALLSQAEHPGTSPVEAAQYRQRADEIMLKYRIAEADLDRTVGKGTSQTPTKIEVTICPNDSPLRDQLTGLVMIVAKHFGVRVLFHNLAVPKGRSKYYPDACVAAYGYPTDLEFFALLFGSLHLHLAGKLEPQPDLSKGLDENVYDLHESGMSWRRITALINPEVTEEMEIRKAANRLKRAYRRRCAVVGHEPRVIQSPVNYQRNVIVGFNATIDRRLREVRERHEAEIAGSALALRSDLVDEFFKEQNPKVSIKKVKMARVDYRALGQGWVAGETASLNLDQGVGPRNAPPLKG